MRQWQFSGAMRNGFITAGFPQMLALAFIPRQPEVWPNLAEGGEKALQVEVLKQGSRQSFSDIRASPWSLPASLCQLVLQPAPWGERVSDSERNMFFSPTIWKMCCLHSQQNLFFPLLMGHMPLSEPVFVADLYSAS